LLSDVELQSIAKLGETEKLKGKILEKLDSLLRDRIATSYESMEAM